MSGHAKTIRVAARQTTGLTGLYTDMNEISTQRDATTGRFLTGNNFGKHQGNPHCKVLYHLREAFLQSCGPDEVRRLTARLIELAHDSNKHVSLEAISLLLDRALGRPKESLAIELNQEQPQHDVSMYSDDQIKRMLEILNEPVGVTT